MKLPTDLEKIITGLAREKEVKAKKYPIKIEVCAYCKKEFHYISHPRKYCTTECRTVAYQKRNEIDHTKTRYCVSCRTPLPLGENVYCSDECRKKELYARNKNPLSLYGGASDSDYGRDIHYIHGSVRSMNVSPEILAKAEENEEKRRIVEDTQEIFKIIFEELNNPNIRTPSYQYYLKKHKIKRRALAKKNNKTSPLDKPPRRVNYYYKY